MPPGRPLRLVLAWLPVALALCLSPSGALAREGRLRVLAWSNVTGNLMVGADALGAAWATTASSDEDGITLYADVSFPDRGAYGGGVEVLYGNLGVEANVLYIPEAARVTFTGEGRVTILVPPPVRITLSESQAIENIVSSLGLNYHFRPDEPWDVSVGGMVVLSLWDAFTVPVVEDLPRNPFDPGFFADLDAALDRISDVSPGDYVSWGLNLGGRYDVGDRTSLIGSVKYYFGREITVPVNEDARAFFEDVDNSGRVSGVAVSFGLGLRIL